jgi:hypothetical protein
MHGIKIKNSAHEILIDGEYKNLSLHESGTATISNNGTDSGYNTLVNFANSVSQIPIILVRPSTDWAIIFDSYVRSGSNYTGFYLSTQFNKSTSIEWKCYIGHPTSANEGYGLRVKNSKGEFIFDSSRKYFKIFQVESFSLPNSSDIYTISHNALSNPYYLLTPSGIWNVIVIPGPPNWIHGVYRVGILKINATSAKCFWVPNMQYTVGGPGGTGSWKPTHEVLTCDVN